MKTFEQFLKLKEAPMADYQGQQHAGFPGARPDFAGPERGPEHPMQQHSLGDMNKADTDISDAFADPQQYPQMFADLYERIAALEKQMA